MPSNNSKCFFWIFLSNLAAEPGTTLRDSLFHTPHPLPPFQSNQFVLSAGFIARALGICSASLLDHISGYFLSLLLHWLDHALHSWSGEKLHRWEIVFYVCALLSHSGWPFVTPWTAAHQAPLSMGILQARTLEWVAVPFSRDQPQGSNPGLLHCRWILYCLNHQVSPRILEWVAYPFPRGSSWPSDWTWVSCIVGKFFTIWTTREALVCLK